MAAGNPNSSLSRGVAIATAATFLLQRSPFAHTRNVSLRVEALGSSYIRRDHPCPHRRFVYSEYEARVGVWSRGDGVVAWTRRMTLELAVWVRTAAVDRGRRAGASVICSPALTGERPDQVGHPDPYVVAGGVA